MKAILAFILAVACFGAEPEVEKHEYKAEVTRVMDIIINSLYSNREIFLRELISNAADATDKVRYLATTDPALLEGDLGNLDIKIRLDKDTKTLTITDKGIGMTKAELIKNLGIVGKSGTTEFLDAASKQGADKLSLIGQFGVGFYSVYLVADRVTVVSKSMNDKQHIWESAADGDFSVAEDPRGDTLGRGTSIILHLKEDAEDFLKDDEVTKIVERYSQFVNFPIKLYKSRQVKKEVPVEPEQKEEKKADDEEQKTAEDLEVTEDEEEAAEKKPQTKTVTEEVWDYEQLNKAKPIWTRDPKDITEEDYQAFFKTLTKKGPSGGYLDKAHFTAEGEINFKALLYIPEKADPAIYSELFNMRKSGVQLYVRRVLISDEFDEFLPRYMNFIRGIVDSEDLPLNVSRETLSQSRILQVMAKKLVRKVLDMLRQMAEASEAPKKEGENDGEAKEEAAKATDYEKFWQEYGKSIKFGVVDDRKNKAKLVPLLRYKTSTSEGKFVSLASYVSRMKPDQKYIYYMTGENDEKIKNSPFLEKLTAKGYEVLYMSDPLDEYVVNGVTEYENVELQSATKEGLKLGDDERKALKKNKETYKPLTEWFSKIYGKRVEKVVVSNRLGSSPCVLVTGQFGASANMQRIMKGSTLQSAPSYAVGQKTLEINVQHPIMQALFTKITGDQEDESLIDLAELLLDAANVASGFGISEHQPFYERMNKLVGAGLGLDPKAKADVEEVDAPEPEEDAEGSPQAEEKDDEEGGHTEL